MREGLFNIYPIRRIEEGLSVITGLPCGEAVAAGGETPLPDGGFTPDSVYARAQARLKAFSERASGADAGTKAAEPT